MSTSLQRLSALVDYAQQALSTRSQPVSNLSDSVGFLLFDHQAQGIAGVRQNHAGPQGNDDIWLSVAQPPAPSVPPPADSAWFAPWLNVGNGPLSAPALAREIDASALIAAGTHRDANVTTGDFAVPAIASHARVALDVYPFREKVLALHTQYVKEGWQPWAEAERNRRQLAQLYVKLFTLRQELAGSLGEGQIELVWAMGLAVASVGGRKFVHPLVTCAVELTFHPQTHAAEIRPRDADPRLELAFLAHSDRTALAAAEKSTETFLSNATESLSPFDPSSYAPLLDIARRTIGMAPSGGQDGVAGRSEEAFQVVDAWVLFARPRSSSETVLDLERFRSLLNAWPKEAVMPGAASALVTEPAARRESLTVTSYRGVSAAYHEKTTPSQEAVRDLYFPKPYNDEQARIAQLLESSDGVVVQGPPGTGKTHTIANIVCHWLANGRRVLVTSMRDPALAVLRDQLPEAIRPLAISLLAAEPGDAEPFERSIRKIATEVQSMDLSLAAREVERVEQTIDALHAHLKRIDTDMGRWAKLNLSRIDMEGDIIAPQDAALEVVRHAGSFEWIPDPLGVGPHYALRLGAAELARLRDARRQLGPDIEYLGCPLPVPGDFPSAPKMSQAHEELQRVSRLMETARSADLPAMSGAEAGVIAEARALTELLARLNWLRAELDTARLPWSGEVLERIKRGEPRSLFEVFHGLAAEIEQLAEQRTRLLAQPVAMPEAAESDADFLRAVTNLSEGRRAFGMVAAFGKSDIRKYLDQVRVAGSPPASPEEWQRVAEFISLQKKRRELTARWNALAPEIGFHSVLTADAKGRLSAESQLALYSRVRELAAMEDELRRRAMSLFPGWAPAAMAVKDRAALAALERVIAHHLEKFRVSESAELLERMQRILDGKRGPVVEVLRRFFSHTLGNPAVSDGALRAEWAAAIAELVRLQNLSAPLQAVAEVLALVTQSGAPRLARRLMQPAPADAQQGVPETFLRDWRLRRMATHLAAIDSHEEFKKLSTVRAGVEHDLALAYEELVVRRSWLKLAGNATPEVRAALQAYLNAIQHIGKGTDRRALRYRRDARRAAALAQQAVPCWIMPHYRVSETLPAQLGCFDLVVIDEASQSDLSALPVWLRARKILVVGDDRQVSPQVIGVEEERIRNLMRRHLDTQVPLYRAQMSPERSIYDLAKVVFGDAGVMLKEHFRCIAPIIEYSKREFYEHELRPLRLPGNSERLDPPLIDCFIENARREQDINADEVEFIVGEIGLLTSNPKMRRRSVGVVSLLGEAQALRIWERLTEELSPEVIRRHALSCGDARLFQGRERDVMFLSMVAAPNEVGAPLSLDGYAQRFNVAASRARDRMILVRSVEVHHLSEADRLRRGLIQHFSKPFGEERPRVTDLRQVCESAMERDLFDWLNAQGYQVTPQVAVGAYRIDLVVEGRQDARLAIECDGDRYLGPEQWVEDMRRQRALERLGWIFWRCFSATLTRCREAALADLRASLDAQGIEPIGRGGWGRRRLTEARRVLAARKAMVA